MKSKKTIIGVGIVFFLMLVAVIPLFQSGYIPTHDGEYHIIRFIEFFRMVQAGYWFPRWAPTLNSGYGLPIFIFHYPFPNYIGTVFQSFGLQATQAFPLSLAFGYIVAGICSFFWLKKLFGVKAAVTGAAVGSFVPYWFVDIYVRGSVGEVWAIAWLFVALTLCEYKRYVLLAFAVGGLIVSHNILAMVFIPFLFGYVLIRNRQCVWSIILGIFIASYFWIPALAERQFVVGLNIVNVKDHFVQLYELLVPSWGTGLSDKSFGADKMSFQIGIMPIIMIFLSFIMMLKGKVRYKYLHYYVFILTGCIIFLMTTASMRVWETFWNMQLIQYPWRLLSFMIPFSAFAAAHVSSEIKMKLVSIVIICIAFGLAYQYIHPVVYAPRNDAYYLSRKNFTDGTSSMGNSFSTIWTGWKQNRPGYRLAITNGKMKGDFSKNTILDKKFIVVSDSAAVVFLPILYFPGWTVEVDGKPEQVRFEEDGTITFPVPHGQHEIRVYFSETAIRNIADMVSITALVVAVGWGILGIYAHRHTHRVSAKRP